MSGDKLTPLQLAVLDTLAPFTPRWTLTGGAALVGVYLGHRATKDLDLFWHGLDRLERIPDDITESLRIAGLRVDRIQTAPAFTRLSVSDARETVVVDLVAEPVPWLVAPRTARLGRADFLADDPYEILVNKLTALLSRWEVRDLQDVRALLGTGLDLEQALGDAPKKDGGFSALTLAWVLKNIDVHMTGRQAGLSDAEIGALVTFKAELIDRLTRGAAP